MKFPQRISFVRGKLHLTRAKLAEKIGMTEHQIIKMECPKNKSLPSGEYLLNLLMKFGININYLLTGKGDLFLKSRSYPKYGVSFSRGDVVRLKSGSPRMTVTDFKVGLVHCSWFDEFDEFLGKEFPADALVKVSIREMMESE